MTIVIPPALEDPLRGVPLLLQPAFVRFEDRVDARNERVKLGPHRRARPALSRRNRVLQHLRDCLALAPKRARRRALAHPFNMARTPHPAISIHTIHRPPSARLPRA